MGGSRLIVIALLASGCTADTDVSRVAVRDSAGIEIVEHAPGALEAVPEWTVAPEPLLDLGVVDGDPAYQFFRVAGGLRLEDGRLVIANSGTAELRVYDADGTHLRTVGGRGEGPGEFGFPWAIWRTPADSIAVYDRSLQRLSIHAPDVTFGRVARMGPALLNAPQPAGAFANGDILFADRYFRIPEAGFDTFWVYIHRYGLDGALVDTVGRYPHGLIGRYEKVEMVGGPEFEPRTLATAAGEHVVIGPADSYRLLYLDGDGTLRRIARWHGPDLAVKAEHMDAYRRSALADAENDEDRQFTENFLASQPESKSFAAYDALQADRAGNVWAKASERPGVEGPAEYTVVDVDGRVIARALLPSALRIFEIGEDYVLGVEPDALDVEHVRLYRLVRGDP